VFASDSLNFLQQARLAHSMQRRDDHDAELAAYDLLHRSCELDRRSTVEIARVEELEHANVSGVPISLNCTYQPVAHASCASAKGLNGN
jgi:hypothetical protein